MRLVHVSSGLKGRASLQGMVDKGLHTSSFKMLNSAVLSVILQLLLY